MVRKKLHQAPAVFVLMVIGVLSSATISVQSQDTDTFVRDNYEKTEVLIPMRDGVRLFTSIYVPKDVSEEWPILLSRTPYSVRPYGEEEYRDRIGPSELLARDKYIFVYQDVRGKMMSEGDFEAVRPHILDKSARTDVDESTDTYDTVEWLLNNISNHNGKVGVWGISAPGFYATHALIDSHPAIKAVSPQAPVTDWWMGDDRHHNGAFQLQASFSFLSSYGAPRPEPSTQGARGFRDYGTPDGYRWYLELGPLTNINDRYLKGENKAWNDMMNHPDYDDFWKARTPLPHLKNIQPAVLVVGGFFDAQDLYGPLKTYATIEKNNPETENYLVMGPWYHGGWSRADGDQYGNLFFETKTGVFYREEIERPFFNHFLKGEGNLSLAESSIFVTGSNEWHFFDTWPPPNVENQELYLQPDGGLSFERPDETGSFSQYVSDPATPVPNTPKIVVTRDDRYVMQDQRYAATRPDVLVYESEPLEEDLTVTGELFSDLYVSTSGTDADYIVKLIDVFPGDATCELPEGNCDVPMGHYQHMVRGEVMRARYRNDWSHPEPMKPDEVTPILFDMQDVAHTFKKGHRIMVQIHSTWFPMVDRNTQNYVENLYYAQEEDYRAATHRIYSSSQYPSHLKLQVLR